MNYQAVAKKAKTAITKNGSPCKIVRSTEDVYNPDTNEYEKKEQVISGVAIQESYAAKMIDGTVIRSGDIKFMCALDGEPKEGDVLEFVGKRYSAVSVLSLNPDGKTAIIYTVQGRA